MRLLPVLAVIIAVLVLTVPFINQPFNQDDRDFVAFARAAASGLPGLVIHNYTYDGRFIKNYHDPHGPVLPTYLGMYLKTGARESEALFHALYLIFPLIGAVSMYFLGRRFTCRPLVATLLLIFTPGFLVMSHTLMDDAPGLSLSLAAAALYIFGVDRGDRRLLAGSGLAMMLAALTAYQTLTFLPVLLLYGFLNRKGKKLLLLFLPFIMLAAAGIAWIAITFNVYGRVPAESYKLRGQSYYWPGFETNSGLKPDAILISLAGAAIFPLSVLFLFLRGRKNLAAGALALATAAAVVILLNREALSGGLAQKAQVILLTFAGIVIVYKMILSGSAFFSRSSRRNAADRDGFFLLAWFVLTLGIYVLLLVPYVSVRHLLLTFPPVVLIFTRELDAFWPGRKRRRILFITATLFFTLAAGLGAAIADYRSASVYPALAARLGHLYRQENRQGKTVYFRGEFGYRYYLEQQGFKYQNDRTQLHTGDFIIFSKLSSNSTPWPNASYTPVWKWEPSDWFPVRIWNYWAGAGFYTNRMGPLPVVISQAIQDQFIVYRVQTY